MNLLVCVDLSESTDIIVKQIESLARSLSAKVWLLHNAEPAPDIVEFKVDPLAARESLAKKFHVEHRRIQGLAERLRKAGIETTALLVRGQTVETILQEAEDVKADMIVVGSHGKGAMFQLLVGSVSHRVIQLAHCPCMIAR